jgi:hypothetical protein
LATIPAGRFRPPATKLKNDIVRLESKIDSKPSLMAMFTGILVVVFGMAGVIASTITALNTLGFLRHGVN